VKTLGANTTFVNRVIQFYQETPDPADQRNHDEGTFIHPLALELN
jgi:hypothetical protein